MNKEERKAYDKIYNAKPEVIVKRRIRDSKPERRTYQKIYDSKEENKRKKRIRSKTSKYKAYQKNYSINPTNKIKLKINYEKSKLKKFGLTLEDYDLMFNNQYGCCAICGRLHSEFKKKLAVDHCHSTGKVRGILCSNCNSILGHAHDSIEVLQKAIDYLYINS
jgi:hypothetical protein